MGATLPLIVNAFKGVLTQEGSEVFSDKPHFTPKLSPTKKATVKTEIFSKLVIASKKNYPALVKIFLV